MTERPLLRVINVRMNADGSTANAKRNECRHSMTTTRGFDCSGAASMTESMSLTSFCIASPGVEGPLGTNCGCGSTDLHLARARMKGRGGFG